MLKRGEVDIAYALRGAIAEDVRRRPGLGLKPAHSFGGHWVLFTEQWDQKSLWADRRVRLAVNQAIDRPAINQSITLGFSRMTGSIIPMDFEFYWPAPLYSYDPKKAKQLLTEAGYPNGFEAGELSTDANFADYTEAVANYFAAVGIRTRVRPLERAAYFTQVREKRLRPLVYLASGAYGNAATRLDSFVAAGGLYTYGSYPDIEGPHPGAGRRARPKTPRGHAAPHPAAHARAGDVRARLGDRRPERLRTAGGGAGAEPDRRSPLQRAVRGGPAQGSLSLGGTDAERHARSDAANGHHRVVSPPALVQREPARPLVQVGARRFALSRAVPGRGRVRHQRPGGRGPRHRDRRRQPVRPGRRRQVAVLLSDRAARRRRRPS